VFDAPLELAASVESAPALMFGAHRLLAQMLVWLRARQRGVLALELVWELDARRSNVQHVDAHHPGGQQGRLELRTAQATQDMAHLQRLLGEQLARVTLPAPVLYLRLRTLKTQAMAGESWSLLPEDQRKGDSLHQMLERLSARLGPENVLHAVPHADHRPERMQVWQPISSASKFVANYSYSTGISSTFNAVKTKKRTLKPAKGPTPTHMPAHMAADALFPSWLLTPPLKLAVHRNAPIYQGPLTLLAGPQRLEAGWWGLPQQEAACALRDYFVARSEHMGLLWIYRERLAGASTKQSGGQGSATAGPGWYLHGLFG
jgi:protein ImuB